MINLILKRLLLIAFTAVVMLTSARAYQGIHREFVYSKEKSLKISLEVLFGRISIERGDRDKIAVIEYNEGDENGRKLDISYEDTNDSGILRIKLKEPAGLWNDDEEEHEDHHRHLYIKLSSAVPISFDIRLGAGRGDIDLTGLQVRDMKISTGASDVFMKCGKPNTIIADNIFIESGVGKFTANGLINLNFDKLKFSSGIGSYKLDFDGKFRQNSEAQIELGLGSVIVDIPESTPVKLLYDDNWLSSFKLDDNFEEKHNGEYITKNFQNDRNYLTIRMEAGLGSVQVRQK